MLELLLESYLFGCGASKMVNSPRMHGRARGHSSVGRSRLHTDSLLAAALLFSDVRVIVPFLDLHGLLVVFWT